MNALFAEVCQICAGFGPVDMSAAANNGDWVSMENFGRCTVVFFKAAGTAGDDPILTLKQATDATGTGAKDLNFTRLDMKMGTLTSVGTYTTVIQASASTYQDLTSAEVAGIFVIDVRASDLDVNNGFRFVQFSVPDIGTNAQLGAALYLMREPRYAPPLSALI